MDKKQFDLLQETLIRRYGKEKAYKMLHSNIPEGQFLTSLSMADFEFFVRYFLLECETDPCWIVRHYFTNIDRARAVLLLEGRLPIAPVGSEQDEKPCPSRNYTLKEIIKWMLAGFN